jgi:hypothetical protein
MLVGIHRYPHICSDLVLVSVNLLMVFRVVYEMLTEEFLNSFIINLVSFPIYVNLVHFDPIGNLLPQVLDGMFIIDVSYLLFCKIRLMVFLSFSLLAELRQYVFILLVK